MEEEELDNVDEFDDDADEVDDEAEEAEDVSEEEDEVIVDEEPYAQSNILRIPDASHGTCQGQPNTPQAKSLVVHITPYDERKTQDSMTLFELAAVVGTRAQHIENGDMCYCSTISSDRSIKLAEQEIWEKKCPLIIERTVARVNNHLYVEHWPVNDLAIPYIDIMKED